MALLQINVANKVATYSKRGSGVVCGNSDYVVEFTFDSEWNAYETKTARFIWNNKFIDVEFNGTTCPMPAVHRAEAVCVGVYAGDLCTTTPAVIPCQWSVLCGAAAPHDENEAKYASAAQEAAREAREAADQVMGALGTVGDIETALDEIINIQKTLIGGEGA